MKTVHIYSIYSPLHNKEFMDKKTSELLVSLKDITNYEYKLVPFYDLYKADLSLILVSTGGSEAYFKEMEKDIKEPVFLLTFGNDNSLAASLEILSYIQRKNMKGEILHGSELYLGQRIKQLMEESHD